MPCLEENDAPLWELLWFIYITKYVLFLRGLNIEKGLLKALRIPFLIKAFCAIIKISNSLYVTKFHIKPSSLNELAFIFKKLTD